MIWFLFLVILLLLLVFFLVWTYYPRTGRRREDVPREHKTKEQTTSKEVQPKEAVKTVLVTRIEGIKNKDAQIIKRLTDRNIYTKFDDWPPFELQDFHALDREADALRVLKEYDYTTKDWKINVFGETAIASFVITYRGTIRTLNFTITSRVTAFLVKRDEDWKLIHEHWSRFPEPT